MKKRVRLSENQLVQLIKKVLKEEIGVTETPTPEKVTTCIMKNMDVKDLDGIPTCVKIVTKVFTSKETPNPFDPEYIRDGMLCAKEFAEKIPNTNPIDVANKLMNTADCILGTKTQRIPVMF